MHDRDSSDEDVNSSRARRVTDERRAAVLAERDELNETCANMIKRIAPEIKPSKLTGYLARISGIGWDAVNRWRKRDDKPSRTTRHVMLACINIMQQEKAEHLERIAELDGMIADARVIVATARKTNPVYDYFRYPLRDEQDEQTTAATPTQIMHKMRLQQSRKP